MLDDPLHVYGDSIDGVRGVGRAGEGVSPPFLLPSNLAMKVERAPEQEMTRQDWPGGLLWVNGRRRWRGNVGFFSPKMGKGFGERDLSLSFRFFF